MTRAADLLWRNYKAPRHRLCSSARDARRILSAALKGETLPPTESELHPWQGYRPEDAAKRAERRAEAQRRGRAILLGGMTSDALLSDWAFAREAGEDTGPHWREITRRALDGDALCADVVAGVEAGEAEARET